MGRTTLITVLFLSVSTTFATDRLVPSQYPTIQAAINSARTGDTVIVADGIYTGPGNRDIDFLYKTITVRSENGPQSCIIDCNGTSSGEHRGFIFYWDRYEKPTPVLDGITITNGYADEGGGIYCHHDSIPTIINCIITDNFAVYGGGIYCDSSIPTITNCTIGSNRAADGGGIYCEDHSYLAIYNCIIRGNVADSNGGGICCCGYSNPKVTSCAFSGNSASEGGGIYCYDDSPATITNCTLTANTAVNEGGGIFYYDNSEQMLVNCILWLNEDSTGTGESAQITYDEAPEVTYCCIQDDDPNDSNIPFGGEDNGNIDDDPMFVRDPNDGGDGWGVGFDGFGDLHLQNGSSCINAGDPNSWGGKTDMDDQPRVIDGRIDIGADEYAKKIIITKPEGGEVWVSGSIHEINWSSYGVEGAVDISYSDNNGVGWVAVENNVANTGSYTWHLPDIVDSNQCLVSVVPSIPDPNIVCIESGLFTIHPDNPDPAVELKWETLGGDFKRSGRSYDEGPELGCVKWKFEIDAAVSASVAIGIDDRVHIACEDGKLYTLDANGVLLWSYDTNSPLFSSPTVGPDGTVYVGGRDGRLFAIEAGGELRWTHHTEGFVYSSPAVAPDGKLYVCSQDGMIYALAQDGSELWSFEVGGPAQLRGSVFASPAIGDDGTVYISGLYEPNLYALDPNDGSVKWVCNFQFPIYPDWPEFGTTMGGMPFASPVIAEDGTIYQTLVYDANLYAIAPNDGTIIWSVNLGGGCEWFIECLEYHTVEYCVKRAEVLEECVGWWFEPNYLEKYGDAGGWSEPVLGPDGTIYVSFDDPYLRAVDPNGSFKWVTRLGMVGGFTLTVGDDGLIYAASDDGCLCVVSPDGEEIARFYSDRGLNFPVITADNTLIVADGLDNAMLIGDANNVVWAIGGEDCNDQTLVLHRLQDLDGSRTVDFIDFAVLATGWLECTDTTVSDTYPYKPLCDYEGDGMYLTGDIDKDLYVDFADLADLADKWLSGE